MNDRTRMLQAYLDGELDDEQRFEVQARLEADEDWRQELDELQQVWAAVEALETPPVGAGLWQGVAAGVRARKVQQRGPWTVTQKFSAAAAMAAGIVVGFGFGNRSVETTLATDVATSSVSVTSQYQDELPTLDAMWLQLGSTDEDSES